MRGNKDIFYCHLLPFVTTYWGHLQKRVDSIAQ